MIALGCVTGRFQPVHDQHVQLFEIALAECEHLILAVTNPDPGARHQDATSSHRHTPAANPFTYFERARLLETAAQSHGLLARVTIVPFDLTRPVEWPQYVPLSARQFVRAYSDWERRKAEMLCDAGYTVSVLDGDPTSRLSSTDVRAAIRAGRWRGCVPSAIAALLAELLERAPIGERT